MRASRLVNYALAPRRKSVSRSAAIVNDARHELSARNDAFRETNRISILDSCYRRRLLSSFIYLFRQSLLNF